GGVLFNFRLGHIVNLNQTTLAKPAVNTFAARHMHSESGINQAITRLRRREGLPEDNKYDWLFLHRQRFTANRNLLCSESSKV
ncbi:MAG: hypothetical protein OSA40_12095, partial [Phycisphaerales bacterium]|nr:hypothetical protein [Phycisphaerales bacterium]